ncbi:MAG: hypothetical protein QNJ81_14445 [Acidimicrobiia bacterium]|nr:hypothetical protein [Acidimicrobiia bacterium]
MADEIDPNESARLVNEILENFRESSNTMSGFVKQRLQQRMVEAGKTTKSIEAMNKAINKSTDTLGKLGSGGVDLVKSLSNADAEFTTLNGIVGTVGSALSGLASAIPIFGSALESFGEAATAGVQLSIDKIQTAYNSFQTLSDSGLLGAGAFDDLRGRVEEANIPFAKYTQLLKNNSENLMFLGGSALHGGNTLTKSVEMFQKGAGRSMRLLGVDVDEFSDTMVDYQVLQRQLGMRQAMTTQELFKSTEDYVTELDAMAKLTGMSRQELQKEYDDKMRNARFNAYLQTLSKKEATAQLAMATMLEKVSPDLAKGYMDQAAGFLATEEAQKLMVSGFGDAAANAIANLKSAEDVPKAMKGFVDVAQTMTKDGGLIQSFALAMGDDGPFLQFYGLTKVAALNQEKMVELMPDVIKTIEDQKDKNNEANKTTSDLTESVEKLQTATSKLELAFTESDGMISVINTTTGVMAKLAEKILEIVSDGEETAPKRNERGAARAARQRRAAETAAVVEEQKEYDALKAEYDALKKTGKGAGRANANTETAKRLRTLKSEMSELEDIMDEKKRAASGRKSFGEALSSAFDGGGATAPRNNRMSRNRNRNRRSTPAEVEIASTAEPITIPITPPESLEDKVESGERLSRAERRKLSRFRHMTEDGEYISGSSMPKADVARLVDKRENDKVLARMYGQMYEQGQITADRRDSLLEELKQGMDGMAKAAQADKDARRQEAWDAMTPEQQRAANKAGMAFGNEYGSPVNQPDAKGPDLTALTEPLAAIAKNTADTLEESKRTNRTLQNQVNSNNAHGK